ncbi:hypothetical protein LguiA_015216 [Lonicera macranthoides]
MRIHLRQFNNNNPLAMIIISFTFILFFSSPSIGTTSVLDARVNPLVELSSREELVNAAGYGEEKLSNVLVSGSVVCNACFDGHPRPVSGASVVVSCHTSGNRMKSNWAKGTTDEYGDFLIDIPSHLHAISNLEKLCLVKVIHLPKNSLCHTAFPRKQKAIQLSSVGNGIRTYMAQTIRMTPKSSQACTNTEGGIFN